MSYVTVARLIENKDTIHKYYTEHKSTLLNV